MHKMQHARGAWLDQAPGLFVFPRLFSNRYCFTGTEFNSCCLSSGAELAPGREVGVKFGTQLLDQW